MIAIGLVIAVIVVIAVNGIGTEDSRDDGFNDY
jgi:hypothetical protein